MEETQLTDIETQENNTPELVKEKEDNVVRPEVPEETDLIPEDKTGDCSEIMVFFISMVVSIIASMLLDIPISKMPLGNGWKDVLYSLANYGIWLGAMIVLIRGYKKTDPGLLGFRDDLPYQVPAKKKMTVKVAILSIMALCVGQTLARLAGEAVGSANHNGSRESFEAISLVSTLILAPVFEELIFRGFLQKNLRKYGDFSAILLASLTFGLAHGSIRAGTGAFIHGMLFGILTINYGIGWSMAAHFLANVPAALEKLFPGVSLNFALGKHLYIMNISSVLFYLEMYICLAALLGFVIYVVFIKKDEYLPPVEDIVREEDVSFSCALIFPIVMCFLMLGMRLL